MKVLGSRIAVVVMKADSENKNGLIIPESVLENENTLKGKVVSFGRGKLTSSGKIVPHEVKENDVVLFHKHSGMEINYNNDKYRMIGMDDVLAVVDEKKDSK